MLTGRKAGICVGLLVALVYLGALTAQAYATFPGRDGRITWVESEHTPPGQFAGGTMFFVNQRLPAGEPNDNEGYMQCFRSVDADASELCPFADANPSPNGLTIVVGVTRALTEEYKSPRRANLALEEANSRDLSGRALPDLTEADRDPAWSPDGRQLVFVGQVDEVRDVFVVDRDGQNLRRLTSDAQVEANPVWSPRGQIAFQRGLGISSVRADGTGLRRLTARGVRPDWSPDGRRLIFQRGRRLFIVSHTGRRVRQLAGTGSFPAWSPSGRRIAFRHRYDIYTANPDGTKRRRVYDWPAPRKRSAARRHAPRDISWGPRQR